MAYHLHARHFENVLAMDSHSRLRYAVKRIVDFEEAFVLSRWGKLAMYGDDEAGQAVGVWPHPDFARLNAIEEHNNHAARRLSLDKLLRNLDSNQSPDQWAVFPLPDQPAIVLPYGRFRDAIDRELEWYA